MPSSLLLRADATPQIGTGHIMRCIALAQASQSFGMVPHFASARITDALINRLQAERFQLHQLKVRPGGPDDVASTIALARSLDADWLVLDGYHFDVSFQQAAKTNHLPLLVIDDYGQNPACLSDFVLNQNGYATETMYSQHEPGTRLLLGTRFTLLRKEFWKWRGWQRPAGNVKRRVLVTMGGSDPDNVTVQVLQALQGQEIEISLIVGGSNPHVDVIQDFIRQQALPVRLLHDVANMPELMEATDVAVSAAGSTCWELAFMGVPQLLLPLANNQTFNAIWMTTQGIGLSVDVPCELTKVYIQNALEVLFARHAAIVPKAQTIVDGYGADRVLMHLRGDKLRLRKATLHDSRDIWELANDTTVRATSFSMEQISWETHSRWFQQKITSSDCCLFLAFDPEDKFAGQVRFDMQADGSVVIGVSLKAEYRGKGLGSAMLILAVERFQAANGERIIHAYIKEQNSVSLRAFARAGFTECGTEIVEGYTVKHLIKE